MYLYRFRKGREMKQSTAIKIIEKELADLAIKPNCAAWGMIYENAIEAAEIMTKKELIKFIELSHNELSNMYFY
jgi:hypothetical protein